MEQLEKINIYRGDLMRPIKENKKTIVRRFKDGSFLVRIKDRHQCYVEKRDGVVYLQLSVCVDQYTYPSQSVLKLPDEFLPERNKEFIAHINLKPVMCKITRDGTLSFEQSMYSGSWICANITYLAR